MACPNTEKCPLFPLFRTKENLHFWQTLYCHTRFEACERYQLSARGLRPDTDLLPNGERLAPSKLRALTA